MINLHGTFEDLKFTAKRDENGWNVLVFDLLSGKNGEFKGLSDAVFGAIMALAVGIGESAEIRENAIDVLYSLADPVFEGVDTEVRMIP